MKAGFYGSAPWALTTPHPMSPDDLSFVSDPGKLRAPEPDWCAEPKSIVRARCGRRHRVLRSRSVRSPYDPLNPYQSSSRSFVRVRPWLLSAPVPRSASDEGFVRDHAVRT